MMKHLLAIDEIKISEMRKISKKVGTIKAGVRRTRQIFLRNIGGDQVDSYNFSLFGIRSIPKHCRYPTVSTTAI